MIINILQLIIRQIHSIDCICSLKECLRIILIFNNGLFQLFIISIQSSPFICCVFIFILERFKSQNKMVQSAILCFVHKQYRHPSTANTIFLSILIRKFYLLTFITKLLRKIRNLQFIPHTLTVFIHSQFLHDLLDSTGIASILGKKESRTRTQHIVLI